MNRQRRPLAALALIAIVPLLSACGSSAPAATGAGSGAGITATNHTKAMRFAECMRHNGVSAFPDPSGSSQFTIDEIANGSSLDTNSPAFTQAVSACKSLEPAGFTGTKRSAQQQTAGLKFAECIRKNGVPDFPDPTPNGPLVDTNRIPSAATSSGMSSLNAAMHTCGSLVASIVGSRR